MDVADTKGRNIQSMIEQKSQQKEFEGKYSQNQFFGNNNQSQPTI